MDATLGRVDPIEFVVARDGLDLHAWEWPGGEPAVLLLHGIGNYGRYWDLVAREVGGRLRLVTPDARGHGDSAKPDEGYAATDFVGDALAILGDRGIDRGIVVGHSMGGGHSLALTLAHPERVRGLALVDVGSETMPEGSERARRLSRERPERFATEQEALAYLRRTSPGYGDEVYANRVAHAFRRDEGGGFLWRSSHDALARIFGAGGAGERWRRLGEIGCPVTLIRGTRSNVLAAEVARQMLGALRDGKLLEVDAGHNPPLEQPAAVASAILDLAARSR